MFYIITVNIVFGLMDFEIPILCAEESIKIEFVIRVLTIFNNKNFGMI